MLWCQPSLAMLWCQSCSGASHALVPVRWVFRLEARAHAVHSASPLARVYALLVQTLGTYL
eukprot:254336-Chlamydomonas_euryale.AAC.1